jgi:SagB-type dehydrogenase family enzyme
MKRSNREKAFRRRLLFGAMQAAILCAGTIAGSIMKGASAETRGASGRIALPRPALDRPLTVAAAIRSRRSIRDFIPGSVTLEDMSEILWAAQGITDPAGYRTAPSAGALYPLEVQLIAGDVESLPAGVYRYSPREHVLDTVAAGDRRKTIAEAALSQRWIADAAAILVIAAVEERTTVKYGRRGLRYVHIEIGHAAQNVYLQAAALGLGTTIVGAFDDDKVKDVADLGRDETPLCLLPIGRH